MTRPHTRWVVNPPMVLRGPVRTCGPDDPAEMVDAFVNPITQTVVQLSRPVPYDDFAEGWTAIARWLRDGWILLHFDPQEL